MAGQELKFEQYAQIHSVGMIQQVPKHYFRFSHTSGREVRKTKYFLEH